MDSRARPGAMLAIGAAIGPDGGSHGTALFAAAVEGGLVRTKPVTGDLRGSASLEALAHWKRFAFRLGPRVGFSWVDGDYASRVGASVGGTLGLLPVVKLRTSNDRRCLEQWTSYHVGLATQADYEWADHRGHFAFGPSVELYSGGGCD